MKPWIKRVLAKDFTKVFPILNLVENGVPSSFFGLINLSAQSVLQDQIIQFWILLKLAIIAGCYIIPLRVTPFVAFKQENSFLKEVQRASLI